MSRRNRRGFTFAELMIVVLVIAILAGMMVMRYIAFTKFYDTGQWPNAAGPGVMPPELVPYLGAGFSFTRPDYTLEFENFVPPGGGTSATYQVAIRFSSSNQNLVNTMIQVVGDRSPYIVLGSDVVVVLVGPDGQT